jgi:glucose/mannose-6-phosphate isomerase
MNSVAFASSYPRATSEECSEALNALRKVDAQGMLGAALQMTSQIITAQEVVRDFHEGDAPLDRTKLHLVGLGGSAIAGELLRDMIAPKKGVSVHRGTKPPRDKAGVIVSSYSGNTRELIELSFLVTGGLRPVIFLTSGGLLEKIGKDNSIPIWKMPAGFQPRAAVGWSLALVAAVISRWMVVPEISDHLILAARKFIGKLNPAEPAANPLVQLALPLADSLVGRTTVIFHSLQCTGAARRLAAQINENGKQAAFALVMPEAMHNGVEGLIGADNPERWTLLFMSDQNDPDSLHEAMNRTRNFFAGAGFLCGEFPSEGDNSYEQTISRVFIADMTSLFLAARRGVDPTPIPTIVGMKKLEPPIDAALLPVDRVEFH